MNLKSPTFVISKQQEEQIQDIYHHTHPCPTDPTLQP